MIRSAILTGRMFRLLGGGDRGQERGLLEGEEPEGEEIQIPFAAGVRMEGVEEDGQL